MLKTQTQCSLLFLLLQMWEGRLQQVGHVLLHVALIVACVACIQSYTDFTLFHQVKHVGEDGGVHRQTCSHKTHRSIIKYNMIMLVFSLAVKHALNVIEKICMTVMRIWGQNVCNYNDNCTNNGHNSFFFSLYFAHIFSAFDFHWKMS